MTKTAHQEHHYHFGRGGRDAEHQKHQADIQALLDQHHLIDRVVEILPNGFNAITTSTDTYVATILQTHITDMKARFAKGRAIRSWDHVYALLFAYREQIHVEYQLISNGVQSKVTTDNQNLVAVLHAHAHAVSGFVTEGRKAASESYPLSPETLEKLPLHPHN